MLFMVVCAGESLSGDGVGIHTNIAEAKNPYSKLALLSGKFLRVRKCFACMIPNLQD